MRSAVAVLVAAVLSVFFVACGKDKKMQLPKTPDQIVAPTPSRAPLPSQPGGKPNIDTGDNDELPPAAEEPATGGRCLGKYDNGAGGAITFFEDHTCKMEASGFVADRNECAYSMSEGEVRVTAKKQYTQTGSFAADCSFGTFGGLKFIKVK